MQCLLVCGALALALSADGSEARRLLRQDAVGPVTEIREEMRLRKAWNGDIADPDPVADQKHLAKELDRSNSPFKGTLPWEDEEDETSAATAMNVDILDSMERASPLAAAKNEPDKVRGERSVRSVKRQRLDADPRNTRPMFEVSEEKEPDFFGEVFGKPPEEQHLGDLSRQLWDLAGAKAGHWGEIPKPPAKIVPWRPDVDISLAQKKEEAPEDDEDEEEEEEEDPTGGAQHFVAPCPAATVLHPTTCPTSLTESRTLDKPVKCPAIQKACGTGSGSPMMKLVCNGSCCPVCWAPDDVIGLNRHTGGVHNEDVVPPHPGAPSNCAGVKCFTPLCLRGYEAGHFAGACCASCKLST